MKTTWTAQLYDEDFRPFTGHLRMPVDMNIRKKKFTPRDDLPEEFDLRKKYPNCETISEIRDQSRCGASWAFASVEVMSDRLCIQSQGKLQTRVSAENVLACCEYCGSGCQGGGTPAGQDALRR